MARPCEMTTITRDEFAKLRQAIPAVTKEGVMETYRISQNSWYKLRDGKPVRQSVINRLRERYAALTS